MRPRPLIVVDDVRNSTRFYRELLGAVLGGDGSGHDTGDPPAYDALYDPSVHPGGWASDGMILQIHARDVEHHHQPLGDIDAPVGNGVILWFEVDDFDDAVDRTRRLGAPILLDVYSNPNSGRRELWLQDPDGYTVVLSST